MPAANRWRMRDFLGAHVVGGGVEEVILHTPIHEGDLMSYVQKFSVKNGTDPANPLRLVEVGKFGNRSFEVVTGYDVTNDRWPVHLYSTDANGERTKVPMGDSYADEPGAAFKRGWREIEEYFSI